MAQKLHGLETTAYIKSIDSVFHYTCNPPSDDILNKHNIKPIGINFNCGNNREVLIIPKELFDKFGYSVSDDKNILTMNSEYLLRDLERIYIGKN
jgi:hypothetical protein